MKIIISIEWWKSGSGLLVNPQEIPENHKGELEIIALNTIQLKREEGFIYGQIESIIGDKNYRGLWEVKTR